MHDNLWIALIALATLIIKEGLDWYKQWRIEGKANEIKATVQHVEALTNGGSVRQADDARAAGREMGFREGRDSTRPPLTDG